MQPESRFSLLSHVVEISNSSVDINERLDTILGAVSAYANTKNTALFLKDQPKNPLKLANIWPRREMGGLYTELDPGLRVITEAAVKRQVKNISINDEKIKFPADMAEAGDQVTAFPVMDDNRVYGVLALVFENGRKFAKKDLPLFKMISREIAGAVRNFRLYFESKRRIAELNVLSDLGRAAVSTIEIDELLDVVASVCAKLLGAKAGFVKIVSRNGKRLTMQARHGHIPESCINGMDCDLSDDGFKAERGQTICARSNGEGIKEGLCVPLIFKGNHKGRICVFDKSFKSEGVAEGGFSLADRNLLTTMATMISGAIENAITVQRIEDLAQRNEEMVGALATLYEISTLLMTTVDFRQTIEIIMQAVIHPAGLDFDRVMLFLISKEESLLRPVAELSKEESAAPTMELTKTLLESISGRRASHKSINEGLAELEVELDPKKSILARTVAEKQFIHVRKVKKGENVSPQFFDVFGPSELVTVPMFSKGKVIGVLVVNNHLSRREMTDRDIKLLCMLANQGGLSVENSRLYQNLEHANRELAQMRNRLLEADKLAALGEIASGVAHEIRNPLVSIGGFTRRIRKKIEADSPIKPYLDVIIKEVTRLEATLNEMLDFSSDTRGNFEEHDLNQVMEDALELIQVELSGSDIKVRRDFSPDLPKVFCDDRQIKHVFYNIYLNAVQALNKKGGSLTLRSFSVMREGKQFVAGEVRDTGGGIPMDVIHNIFNPFFTTKDTGSGLGLSIAHKIVTRHFGQVEVHNTEGKGASFLITLPAAEEGRAYLK